MKKVGVIGASGYTGAELVKYLTAHQKVELVCVTSRQYAGQPVSSLYPACIGYTDLEFTGYDPGVIAGKCDLVFLGLPHGESMKVAGELYSAGVKVIDLSADFRFDDVQLYEEVYQEKHCCPEILSKAVYGLPEVNKNAIREAEIVANPGCYPTASLIGLYPVARQGLISGNVFIDAKSGVSGAGRKLSATTQYCQVADGIAPYAVSGHRHEPEISAELKKMAGDADVVFTPHLVPMNRGILATIYVPLSRRVTVDEVRAIYVDAYSEEPFVFLLDKGVYPQTKAVQGSNNCHVGLELRCNGEMLIIMSAIDNLVKGASGQAVQNMNLMYGFAEVKILKGPGLFP